MRLYHVIMALIMILLLPNLLPAAIWNVSPTGCSDSACNPCCTIQGAVLKSWAGDTISIGRTGIQLDGPS